MKFRLPKTSSKTNIFQYIAAVTGTLSMLVNGMQYGWTSPYLPTLLEDNSEIHITEDEGNQIAIYILVGLGIGCATGSLLSDIIGRRTCALISSPLFITSAVLTMYATSAEYFYIIRGLAGVADGIAFTSMPMYLGEVASPNIRGLLGSSVGFAFIFGTFLVNILGIYMTMQQFAIILCVLPLIYLVTFSLMPESPYYYVKRNNLEAARRSLQIFRGEDNVDEELNEIQAAVTKQELHGKYIHLFTVPSNRKALFVVLGLRTIQEFSGITVFVFYTKTIFSQGGGRIPASWCAVLFTAVQALVSSITTLIVDKTGRKPLLVISAIGSGLALVTEGVYFYCRDELNVISEESSWVSVVTLIAYMVLFALGLGPIPILMLGEMFPTGIKAPAMCLMGIYYAVVSAAATTIYQFFNDEYGLYVPFFIFAICCWIGIVFIVKMVPETTNKTLQEIQDALGAANDSTK